MPLSERQQAIIWEDTLDPAKREKLAKSIAKGSTAQHVIDEMRRLCQTDLWYLARHVIGNDWLTERTHKPICDFFVRKDPAKPFEEQDTVKERMLMYPRGSLKSTLNIIDTVQWILTFPDIVIIILTGGSDLAISFVDELKNYFICEQDEDTGDWANPTLLQALFPEFSVSLKKKEKGKSGRFTTPARKKYQKEPTVLAASVSTRNAGKHSWVMKFDDAINEVNSETPAQLAKLIDKIAMLINLVVSHGYVDLVGTRYSLEDAYGKKLATHGITALYGAATTPDFKYLCRPAWWIKDTDYQLPDLEQGLPEAATLDLLFPEQQSYRVLVKKLRDNKQTFCSQQLNDPVGADAVMFRREDLVNATIPVTQLPRDNYKIFITWDLAYKAKRQRDYTVGAVGMLDDQGRIFVIDIIRGRYQQHELPFVIAKAIKDHNPIQSGIEDTNWVRYIFTDVNTQCQKLGADASCINWLTVDNREGAKAIRVGYLGQLLDTNRLYFCMSIDCLETLYTEFERFTGVHSGHDDIPDAISMLANYLPQVNSPEVSAARNDALEKFRQNDWYDQVFMLGVHAPIEKRIGDAFTDEYFDPSTGLFMRCTR